MKRYVIWGSILFAYCVFVGLYANTTDFNWSYGADCLYNSSTTDYNRNNHTNVYHPNIDNSSNSSDIYNNKSGKKKYESVCWKCKEPITEKLEKCEKCGWYICKACSACGCNYPKRK
jgi:hypothetical protein